jgi:hypothetical protein
MATTQEPMMLLKLPLEIRLAIWKLCICPYAEADCCEQAVPNSSRRLSENPWYPSPPLPTFTYPRPHTPLRLICRQANNEITGHTTLPPLIARVCDFMCLRRAINHILSNRTSTPNQIDPGHIAAFKVTSERMSLHRPLYSTSGEETGFSLSMKSSEPENNARIQRLANGIMRELKRHYREVKFAHSEWQDMEARPFTIEVKMLFEVGDPIRTVVCGDRVRKFL